MSISKLTGKALDLGTDAIEDFASTGIDDNSTSTVMTIASTGDVTFTNNVAASYFTGDGSALTGIEGLPSSIFANESAAANTLHIAANSNIGIGTLTPGQPLEIAGASGSHLRLSDAGGNGWEMRGATRLIIYDDGTEKLRVDENGRLGIGTDTPGTLLSVAGTTGDILTIGNENSNYAFSIGNWNSASDSDIDGLLVGSTFGTILRGANAGHVVLALRENDISDGFHVVSGGGNFVTDTTFDTTVATFTADGRVGIKTSNPLSDLAIGDNDNTDSGANVEVRIGCGNASTARSMTITKSKNYTGGGKANVEIRASTGGSDSPIRFYSDNTTERVLFSENGAVSIGNSSPSSTVRLKVQGTSTNTQTVAEIFKIGTTANYDASIMKLWANNSSGDATVTEIKLNALNGFRQYNADDPSNLIDGSYICYSNGAFGGDSYIVVQPGGGGEMRRVSSGSANWYVQGTLSKGAGSFRIPHPLASKRGTHRLVHSFAESPGADLFYSGMVNLVDGIATINIDTEAGMTEGTFVALCREIRRHCTNESGFTAVKSSIANNILTITAEDPTCTDEVFWMVVGERQDLTIYESTMTDDDGKVIVEPLIAAEA